MEHCQQVPWLQEWAESISAIASCLTIIVTIFGFIFIYKQIRGSTAERLYTRMFEIHKIFMEKPKLYEYLNNDNVPENKNEKVQLDILVELILDFFELVLLEVKHLPEETATGWKKYMDDTYSSSKKIQAFLDKNASWYALTREMFHK